MLIAAALLLPNLAHAQVVVNPAALAQLAGVPPPTPVAVMAPAPPPPPRHFYHHHRIILAVAHVAPPTIARPKPAPAPMPVPVVARPAPLKPIALTFAPGSAALPAGATTAIKPYCHPAARLGILARAPGDASDPSIAMRLSLARAFAVRDALVACGVPAQNIIPRALGTVPGQNEDQTLLGTAP